MAKLKNSNFPVQATSRGVVLKIPLKLNSTMFKRSAQSECAPNWFVGHSDEEYHIENCDG